MNYSDLTAAIESTVENSFTAGQLALFVQQTEQKVYNSVRPPVLRKNVTGTLTLGSPYLSLPADYLYTFSVAVIDASGNYSFLLDKDVSFIREAYPLQATVGLPKYYAMFDADSLILGPSPDAYYATELHYGFYPESIVTADTSWLGDNFDSVLLNGAVIEAARFIKADADMLALYDKMFNESLQLLKVFSDGKLRQDAYRNGQARVPVN
jgi:hypothetical protein